MDLSTVAILLFVYLGMILGNIPGLVLNRSGIALVGAILLILLKGTSLQQATAMIDLPTIVILFCLMILSAQFYYSGFYGFITDRLSKMRLSPKHLLLMLMIIAGFFSAILINDIVCLAMTPLIIKICHLKRLNPIPFLLGLACASNIGSAMTLIGNPQNILIGQVMRLSFGEYLWDALLPTIFGWFAAWQVIIRMTKGKWEHQKGKEKDVIEYPTYNQWQSNKGIGVLIVVLFLFLFSSYPREYVVLAASGLLLFSRRISSKSMLDFVDWQLLILFFGLFIVTQNLVETGLLQQSLSYFETFGISLSSPWILFPFTAVLSNIISNVPAVMLLLPFTPNETFYGSILALSSTLAGNLFILGSIANIIVVSQSTDLGVKISWKQHFRIGAPITAITLVIAAAWLYFKYSFFK